MLFVESIRYADNKLDLQDLLVHGARAQGRRYSSFRGELSAFLSNTSAYGANREQQQFYCREHLQFGEKFARFAFVSLCPSASDCAIVL
jgi:hypothetical protein